jgi:predicted helicase
MFQDIHGILAHFREEKASNRDLGDKFERLIAGYLCREPKYADLFGGRVWLWTEWPHHKIQDTGIDIVAEETATGDVWAIQCKFWQPDSYVPKGDIDSFLATSGKHPFKKRLIVSTTDKWTKNAEDVIHNQHPEVIRIGVSDLADSAIDWSSFTLARPADLKNIPPNKPRPHQDAAIADVLKGLKQADRGKLIMACGTGKTFTALKIVERLVPDAGSVLFLVPSINLISQSLTHWMRDAERPLSPFAVCSDPKVGSNDAEDILTSDLAFPAHTNPRLLAQQITLTKAKFKNHITVIFSTYQSIDRISEAQKTFGLAEFDIVICDEAHRTTGIERTEYGETEASCFLAVHNNDFLKAKKRLYMTATPRVFTPAAKQKAQEAQIPYYEMNDERNYGKELHRLDFSKAIEQKLLSDYKVLVLAVNKTQVSAALQQQFGRTELALEDAVKIVGCWNALKGRTAKNAAGAKPADEIKPMRRAVAFSGTIAASKQIRDLFASVIKEYTGETDKPDDEESKFLRCEVHHVDGKMNALIRKQELTWLKEDTTKEGNLCRILTNARCLSEGVDVPALDAVMFLNARKSQVDVVQSVGRVMRKIPDKDYGYIILPIAIPEGVPPEDALAEHERYKVVWQVLQALRSHDNRFDAEINQIDLNKKLPKRVEVIGVAESGAEYKTGQQITQTLLNFPLQVWEDAILAKIVEKCGSTRYWEYWARDIALIAENQIARIKGLLKSSDAKYRQQFEKFLNSLRKTLNPSISEDDAVEMLAQHLITKPVFDALFEGYEFTKHNPVSKTMQKMLDALHSQNLESENKTLAEFYDSVRAKARAAQGIENAEGRQTIIKELYGKFFQTAFPRMSERLGIVYTPVEVVDFILHSANDALQAEFGVGLTDANVHILDPFTGTGTFIVRLLQSGIIADKDLARKYREELHANEIILLAYYIAAINIEEAFHGRLVGHASSLSTSETAKGNQDGRPTITYEPFEGIVLTDTFQLSEGKGTFDDPTFQVNSKRAQAQEDRDIRVIIGNPPYSVGQSSANEGNQNLKYEHLDGRIEHTYAKHTAATNNTSLYDSYIRAIRWACDRIKDKGIICFVSNGGYIDSNAMNGVRKCLTDELAAIYVFNLRGNIRSFDRAEGENIFGQSSMALIAITIFVKDSAHKGECQLHYHDIGDFLKRGEKLEIIRGFKSGKSVPWQLITPNKHHDWINQRSEEFETFMPVGMREEKGSEDVEALFVMYSCGVATNRDAWAYNFSRKKLAENMSGMIERFNEQVAGYKKAATKGIPVKGFINLDPKKIAWSRGLVADVEKGKSAQFQKECIRASIYRPFTKEHLYFHRQLNNVVFRMPSIFPEANSNNLAICVSAARSRRAYEFSALVVDTLPDQELSSGQCFPLRYYVPPDEENRLHSGHGEWRENVSGYALEKFRAAYKDKSITGEDIFYYVYGVLHSPEYKTRFAADLKKMLPRIPFAADFWAFSKAGRKLADIHLHYESAKLFPVQERADELGFDAQRQYEVQKMRFGKHGKEVDKTVIHYNSHVTLSGIPLAAYEYVVNGRPAIEWIMERYQLSTDKDSGLTNDPNDWAREHDDPPYILNLLKRIITVSLETMKIVKSLPPLNEQTS